MLPGRPLQHIQTMRAHTYAIPVAEWRREYVAPRSLLMWRPPPLVLAAEGLCTPDLAVLFSFSAGCGLRQLCELEISDDTVSDAALALFARAIGRGGMPSLWSTTIARCGVSSQGASVLASALASPDESGRPSLDGLMYLRLMGNQIGDAGAGSLASALDAGAATSLCVLDLSDNPAEGAGTERLMVTCARRDIALQVPMP